MNFITDLTSRNYTAGRNGHAATAIVMHVTTAGTLQGHLDTLLGNTSRNVSAHFLVARDGRCWWLVRLGDSAYANGVLKTLWQDGPIDWHGYASAPTWLRTAIAQGINPNDITISIEHESADGSLTDVQLTTSVALVRYLSGETGIPLDPTHVIGHNVITATDCPQAFPWGDFWKLLHGTETPHTEEAITIMPILTPLTKLPSGPGQPVHYMTYFDNTEEPTGLAIYNSSPNDVTVRWNWDGQDHNWPNSDSTQQFIAAGHQYVPPAPTTTGNTRAFLHLYVDYTPAAPVTQVEEPTVVAYLVTHLKKAA